MKKLLLLIAAISMAVVANAAATDWLLTCGNLKGKDGNAFAGTFELFASGGDLTADVMVFTLTPSQATYNKYAFSTDALTVGSDYTFYYILKDGGNQLTSASSSERSALGTGSQTLNFGNQATYTSNASNWQAVPEPTSGILLLLGVAGLALKRKRA